MIRSIRQRIYVTGILPLAILAVGLVALNGAIRIRDARIQLQNTRDVTGELLHGPAVDALLLGNTLGFQSIAEKAIAASQSLVCISLHDTAQRRLAAAGSCTNASASDAILVRVRPSDLSDFSELDGRERIIGRLHITFNDDVVIKKRNAVLAQLLLSLLLICIVIAVVGKLLRSRLINPIERIDAAMHALSNRDYSTTVAVTGDDELSRLAQAVNLTIATIERYTRELEDRREEADQALQDADEANLAKDALLRTLAEDLEQPLAAMHARLTTIAMANVDLQLKSPIREVIAALQSVQSDFADLLEIAATTHRRRRQSRATVGDVIASIEVEIQRISDIDKLPVHLSVTRHLASEGSGYSRDDMLLSIDIGRLRKAIRYLVLGMSRRSTEAGVFVTLEIIEVPDRKLYVSLQFKAFYCDSRSDPWPSTLLHAHASNSPPSTFGWTERETRVLEYLLREVDMTPTFNFTAPGMARVLLERRVNLTLGESEASSREANQTRDVQTIIVTDDQSLTRVAMRSDLTNDEVRVITFAEASGGALLNTPAEALVLDLTGDVAEAFSLLDIVKASPLRPGVLIAVCPAGNLSDSLSERIFGFGFAAVVQKPINYSRLREVIKSTSASTPRKFIDG